MATFDTPRPFAGDHPLGGRLARLFASLAAALREWNDTRVTRKALGRLSDRELEDIGLTRGDIDRLAEAHARF
ncbi:MAG: DUF1127 domain-containing protein [Alphaproteobacteria bacterium]|nr:MAG: DUF1127 domain-containing protein [Alphaproteobacteria bacterium]